VAIRCTANCQCWVGKPSCNYLRLDFLIPLRALRAMLMTPKRAATYLKGKAAIPYLVTQILRSFLRATISFRLSTQTVPFIRHSLRSGNPFFTTQSWIIVWVAYASRKPAIILLRHFDPSLVVLAGVVGLLLFFQPFPDRLLAIVS